MTIHSVDAYIALGSNLENPQQQLRTALNQLNQLPHMQALKISKLYRSTPLRGDDQPDYINAVAAMTTRLTAHELLTELQKIENEHGRIRTTKRWGARTLDLDLILYGNQIINTPLLIVPHPGLLKRNFVLYPLYDLNPTLVLPNGQALRDLVQQCSKEGLAEI